jgi:predicted anti-sigma-YlaC factor YlaD
MHIRDDFGHQGIMASMKQQEWWKNQPNYNEMYENDYKAALLAHTLQWSIAINLPYLVYVIYMKGIPAFIDGAWMLCCVLVYALTHYKIDDAKANKHAINLIIDQTLHAVQLIILPFVWYLYSIT